MLTKTLRATALVLLCTSMAQAGDDTTAHQSGHQSGHQGHSMATGDKMAMTLTTESGLVISDAYARASTPRAKVGAAFFRIENPTDTADRLINVTSDTAKRVELHTHQDDGNGVMKMRHVPEGFDVPAKGMLMLERGGKHVMLMGLNAPLTEEGEVTVTLTFETAGEVQVTIPVDLKRGAGHGHSGHSN